MPKISMINRKEDSKKGVPRFALVAFKDLLESHVCTTQELSGPKSKGIGATVKTAIHGDVFKGTIVSMADNESSLKKQNQSFNVHGFFGFPKSRRASGSEKHPNKISKPTTNETTRQLTSTPSTSKHRRLSVKTLPSPIKPIQTAINNLSVMSYESTITYHAVSQTSTQVNSINDINDVTVSLVEASYDDSGSNYTESKLSKEGKNQSSILKDGPDMSMNFSSFSSTFDSVQKYIQPLINSTPNIPNYMSAVEIPSRDMDLANQHEVITLKTSSLTISLAPSKKVTKFNRRSRIPVATRSTTKLKVISGTGHKTVSSDPPSSHVINNTDTDRIVGLNTDVYLEAFFSPTSPCSLPSIQDDATTDLDETFNTGGRSETTVILDSLSEEDLTSNNQNSALVSKELECSSEPPTTISKSPESQKSMTPESSGYVVTCNNSRKYDLDSEGDVPMVTILDNQRTPMDTSETQIHSYMNSSNKENISPKTQELFDSQINCDRDRLLQITPTELFYGLMLRSDYPPRMYDASFFTETILLHLKSVSSRPEVFARNLLYRMFTLAELQNSSVYGRGFTNGQRNTAINVDKVRLIKELTFVLYSDVRFSWRYCVLWMDKSIKYVNKLL